MNLFLKLFKYIILLNLTFSKKCVSVSNVILFLPKCSEVTKENSLPCVYDGPKQKKLFPLVSLSPNDSEEYKEENVHSRGDLNEENWSNAEKGHIHYMYRNEGPSGSLGVNELSQQSPSHSSHCMKSEDLKNQEEALLNSKLFKNFPFKSVTNDMEVSSHIVKKCIPVNHLKHVQYSLAIKVGTPPQNIKPIIDTGSTNTWVVSKGCKSDTCREAVSFDSSRSSTFDKIGSGGNNLKIKFGTGIIKGVLATDNITIGEDVIEKQVFGMVNEEISDPKHNVFKVINFQGIVGLGFPRLAFDNHTSLYDNYSKKIGADLIFSIYFTNDKFSSIMLGGVDPRFYKGQIYMLPVIREYYWEVRLSELWVGDNKLCCNEESYVIFDSGTSFNTMPHEEFIQFKRLVSTKTCSNPVTEDDLKQFPTIRYVFDGGVEVNISPKEYVFIHHNKCRVSYMQIDVPSSYGRAFILGTHAFMQHYYTVYKRSTSDSSAMVICNSNLFVQVGFAPSIHSSDLQSELSKLYNSLSS